MQIEDFDRDARTLEHRLRLMAPPLAMVIAIAFERSPLGHMLQRTFLSMAVHELGHATTGWALSYAAFPSLWITAIPEEPSWVVTFFFVAVFGALAWWGRQSEQPVLIALGLGLAVGQVLLRFVGHRTGQSWIIFGGDAGAMVLGTALMCTFFVPPGSPLHRGQLRWGFLVIGAAAFIDVFSTWTRARRDFAEIPFGHNEGSGLSDATKLVDTFGWSERQLLDRHYGLGIACLVVLTGVWAVACWRTREEA